MMKKTLFTALLTFVIAVPAWTTGSIVGWGRLIFGADLSGPFDKVAAGYYHTVGLKSDGSVVCWGDNRLGQCDVPAPNSGFAAVAAVHDHTVGIIAAPEAVPISEAKLSADGAGVMVEGVIVSAAWDEVFYIEADDRSSGVRVEKQSHGLLAGMRANVTGVMKTNLDEERYIEASSAQQNGSGSVEPLGFRGRELGGGFWEYDPGTGAGQPGVSGGSGLNNIGLLVSTWGVVTEIGDGYLYIDDGSNLVDGTFTDAEENIGVRVICDPTGYEIGEKLEVTGVSSCFSTMTGEIVRRILTRGPEDVRKITVP